MHPVDLCYSDDVTERRSSVCFGYFSLILRVTFLPSLCHSFFISYTHTLSFPLPVCIRLWNARLQNTVRKVNSMVCLQLGGNLHDSVHLSKWLRIGWKSSKERSVCWIATTRIGLPGDELNSTQEEKHQSMAHCCFFSHPNTGSNYWSETRIDISSPHE